MPSVNPNKKIYAPLPLPARAPDASTSWPQLILATISVGIMAFAEYGNIYLKDSPAPSKLPQNQSLTKAFNQAVTQLSPSPETIKAACLNTTAIASQILVTPSPSISIQNSTARVQTLLLPVALPFPPNNDNLTIVQLSTSKKETAKDISTQVQQDIQTVALLQRLYEKQIAALEEKNSQLIDDVLRQKAKRLRSKEKKHILQEQIATERNISQRVTCENALLIEQNGKLIERIQTIQEQNEQIQTMASAIDDIHYAIAPSAIDQIKDAMSTAYSLIRFPAAAAILGYAKLYPNHVLNQPVTKVASTFFNRYFIPAAIRGNQ